MEKVTIEQLQADCEKMGEELKKAHEEKEAMRQEYEAKLLRTDKMLGAYIDKCQQLDGQNVWYKIEVEELKQKIAELEEGNKEKIEN